MHYSLFDTDNTLKRIEIKAKDKDTLCVPRFVIWVKLIWVATSRCYEMDVCFRCWPSRTP